MPNIYAVTGGAGFIGSHLAERLLRDGHCVRVIDNLLTGTERNLAYLRTLGGHLEEYRVSVTDLEALRSIFTGVDVVFHQAALPSVPRSIADPLETHFHTVTGTLNVLVAARDCGVRRVVLAASGSAYGDVNVDYKTEDLLPAPKSPYGVAKLAGEYYAQAFWLSYGLETVNLRYFNVFGPRQNPTLQYAAVVPKFITTMLRGERPTIYGDGTQSRDFTYVENIVHGNLLAASAPNVAGHTINCATGKSTTLLELVDKLNDLLGTNLAPVMAPPRPGDILHSRAGVQKARELLGFVPPIDFDTGLARTVEWYRSEQAAG